MGSEQDKGTRARDQDADEIGVVGLDTIEQDLFDRQKRIKGWDQQKINESSILVVGAGATGNELVKNLVLMGLGKIYLIDFDIIERSNLNRCVFFKEIDVNEKNFKADIVAKNASEYGRTKVIPLVERIEDVNESIYKECKVTASCLDNMEARLQLNTYSFFYGIPFVDSGIDGFHGSIFCVIPQDNDSPCLQCGISSKDLDNMWRKYSCTGQEIDKSQGDTEMKMANIITTTSIIGALQAQQIIKIILGIDDFVSKGQWNAYLGPPVYKRELRYDGTRNEFFFIERTRNPSCWICGKRP